MKTVLNSKVDIEVKERAKSLAEYLGVPLSTVVNVYLKEFIKSGSFTVQREPMLRPSVIKELNKAIKEARQGKGMSPTFSTLDDAVAWLDS
jgi:antitoxin component of RelBE/YafQ-DinJ toxin-antitoxin module